MPRRRHPRRTKLDRLARSLPDARETLEDLTRREVRLSINGSVHDPTDPVGRLLFNVLAMVAEFESDLIRLRTKEGLRVARAKGRLRGRQPKLKRSPGSASRRPARRRRAQQHRARRPVRRRALDGVPRDRTRQPTPAACGRHGGRQSHAPITQAAVEPRTANRLGPPTSLHADLRSPTQVPRALRM